MLAAGILSVTLLGQISSLVCFIAEWGLPSLCASGSRSKIMKKSGNDLFLIKPCASGQVAEKDRDVIVLPTDLIIVILGRNDSHRSRPRYVFVILQQTYFPCVMAIVKTR